MKSPVTFVSQGSSLSGLMELPAAPPRAYALFAHCFTCSKDIAAASRISSALTQHGIAVLRFDFTGLGNSDGDFANTNFSSNLQDLVAASDYLRGEFDAPQLLIGHSLGGAAVLAMADQVPEARAVVTIGAPASANHVTHNFGLSLDTINAEGEAPVKLGPRTFNIKKQFLDDLSRFQSANYQNLNKALLVLHSPVDETVNISEAERIYKGATHPKSFISLDQADHLLTKKADSVYVANVIAAWVSRYVQDPLAEKSRDIPVAGGHVLVEEKDHRFTQNVYSDSHHWLADEPTSVGGKNTGPDPYEHLLAGLGACTAMTVRMYASRKKLDLEHVRVSLKHSRTYIEDCQSCDEPDQKIDLISRTIDLQGDLSDEERQRLLQIAEKCPVHKTLHNTIRVDTVMHED